MASKTIQYSGNANDLIKNLSTLQYASDYSKDDLAGKSPTKSTNWYPSVDTSHPMAKFIFSGDILLADPGAGTSLNQVRGEYNSSTKMLKISALEWGTMTKGHLWWKKTVATQVYNEIGSYSGGLPVFKYYKNGNKLYLYCVFKSVYERDKTNKWWIQIAGDSDISAHSCSFIGTYKDGNGNKQSVPLNVTDTKGNVLVSETENNPNNDEPPSDDGSGGDAGNNIQLIDYEGTNEWDNDEAYQNQLYVEDMDAQFDFWKQLYGGTMAGYSLRSHRSIIGLPMQFMGNVDMRVGSSTYGKQYMEDILYDMCIACIKVGGPVINPKWDTNGETGVTGEGFVDSTIKKVGKVAAYWDSLKDYGFQNTMKAYIFSLFRGNSARFYSFMSDYTHYTHYVNTLCHLFAFYLGIGDKTYLKSDGSREKYINYRDDIKDIETDQGSSLGHQFGWDRCVYMYISDENSSLNRNFSNTTTSSQLESTLQTASDTVKEWGFFINAAGIEKGKGIANWTSDLSNAISTAGSNSFLGRLFGNAMEGVSVVLAGNNLSLPEIYQDSDTQVSHTFKIRLVSPYGDPESVFLHVLVPLARILAFSLPRQYGPNSYQSPFIVQAFAKGLFNCQLGIVSSLSIQRGGNGGESHTINHIPTELDVNIEIQDMYEKVFLSNEYFGNSWGKAIFSAGIDKLTGSDVGDGIGTKTLQFFDTATSMRLLFNNVGMIDFVASFCGYNLNMPTLMSGWELIQAIMKNRTNEFIDYSENNGWTFPQWEKSLNDAYNDAVSNLYSTMTLVN